MAGGARLRRDGQVMRFVAPHTGRDRAGVEEPLLVVLPWILVSQSAGTPKQARCGYRVMWIDEGQFWIDLVLGAFRHCTFDRCARRPALVASHACRFSTHHG